MLANIITLLAYLCILLAVLGFFMPAKLGFFLKKPTRGRTVATYLCILFMLTLVHGGLMAQSGQRPEAEPDTTPGVASGIGPAGTGSGVTPATHAPPSSASSGVSGDGAEPASTQTGNTNHNAGATFCALHAELLSFKDTAEFRTKGLQEGSAHASWLERVREAENSFDILEQFSCGVLFGELAKMGEEYARSQGRGTEYTRHMEKEIAKKVKCSKE